jgi:nickel/cobalt transporter (NiCoT) family protein
MPIISPPSTALPAATTPGARASPGGRALFSLAGTLLVGALFALSFDTLSQALLFATTASHYPGSANAIVLGSLFALGMIVTDAMNSMGIARLLDATHAASRLGARIIGLTVSALSFIVAAVGAARLLYPHTDQ